MAILKGDDNRDAHKIGFDVRFPRTVLTTVRHLMAMRTVDLLMVCHLNLLPLAFIFKLRHPTVKIVLFVHGDEVWNRAEFRPRRRGERIMLRVITKIASVSYYTAEVMGREYAIEPSRFVYFPNAVDPLSIAAHVQENSLPIVLVVSRLTRSERGKNVDKVIEAFATVASAVPTSHLYIVGSGELVREYEKLATSLELADRVTFLGQITDEALSDVYQRSSVFALPSDKEGFGIVYLEAWLRHLPVIVSNRGAPSEIVTDGVDGWIVDPTNIGELADRMQQALQDECLSRMMGQRGAHKAESTYSHTAFRARLSGLIEQLS